MATYTETISSVPIAEKQKKSRDKDLLYKGKATDYGYRVTCSRKYENTTHPPWSDRYLQGMVPNPKKTKPWHARHALEVPPLSSSELELDSWECSRQPHPRIMKHVRDFVAANPDLRSHSVDVLDEDSPKQISPTESVAGSLWVERAGLSGSPFRPIDRPESRAREASLDQEVETFTNPDGSYDLGTDPHGILGGYSVLRPLSQQVVNTRSHSQSLSRQAQEQVRSKSSIVGTSAETADQLEGDPETALNVPG